MPISKLFIFLYKHNVVKVFNLKKKNTFMLHYTSQYSGIHNNYINIYFFLTSYRIIVVVLNWFISYLFPL